MQVGLNIGYWEPYALTDVTRGTLLYGEHGSADGDSKIPTNRWASAAKKQGDASNGAFYQVHWHKYSAHLLAANIAIGGPAWRQITLMSPI